MKIFLIVGIVAVVLVGLVIVIGYLLPVKHVAQVEARFARSPDEIWTTITDVKSFPQWRKDVIGVEVISSERGLTRWREESRTGRITFETVEFQAATKFVTRIADRGLPFGGTWTYEISKDGANSVLTISENGEIYNPFFRFVSKFVMGHKATLETYLKFLKVKFERG